MTKVCENIVTDILAKKTRPRILDLSEVRTPVFTASTRSTSNCLAVDSFQRERVIRQKEVYDVFV